MCLRFELYPPPNVWASASGADFFTWQVSFREGGDACEQVEERSLATQPDKLREAVPDLLAAVRVGLVHVTESETESPGASLGAGEDGSMCRRNVGGHPSGRL